MSVDSRRLLSVVAGGVLLVAIGGTQRLIPDADEMYRPIASTGGVKQEVHAQPYAVRVDKVQMGRKLKVESTLGDGEEKTTQGVWVVVHATATAAQEQVTLGDVGLRTRSGRVYEASDRVRGLDATELEAGIPQTGPIAFELPGDEAQGAVLSISKARYGPIWRLVGALGPAIEIDLGLDGLRPAGEVVVKEAGL